MNLETVTRYATLGVEYISVGALTKHIKAIDLSLRVLA
jgi:nicotinate-nucleotide pyrophosphorylase (carboxylating)